jgi:hypothetical protein
LGFPSLSRLPSRPGVDGRAQPEKMLSDGNKPTIPGVWFMATLAGTKLSGETKNA